MADPIVFGALALLVLAVFGQAVRFPFINFDDGQLIFENPAVRAGLTATSIRWAFTSLDLGYYPLTWLSLMADRAVWGLNPAGYHLTAILLHLGSTLILYLALRRMTGALMPSALAAALFAVHPMHVESVVWVSERKDTLSTLFGVIALLLYSGRPGRARLAGVALAFTASLLSKQMLVTLPLVLLLLDFWPLRRLEAKRSVAGLIAEKLPLFALAAVGCAVAVVGQQRLNAIQSSSAVPLAMRVGNAVVAYSTYLGKLIWPANMAPLYPLTAASAGAIAGSALLLVGVTGLAWAYRYKVPSLLTGWLWFLVTLLPVIGLVQIGMQSMADRFTYIPYVGVFVALSFAAYEYLPPRTFIAISVIAVLACTAVAIRQVSYWRSTEALFSHTLDVTGPNPLAEYVLGQSLERTDPDRAITHLRRAIALASAMYGGGVEAPGSPLFAQSHVGIATALIEKAQKERDAATRARFYDAAIEEARAATRLDPNAANASKALAAAESLRRTLP